MTGGAAYWRQHRLTKSGQTRGNYRIAGLPFVKHDDDYDHQWYVEEKVDTRHVRPGRETRNPARTRPGHEPTRRIESLFCRVRGSCRCDWPGGGGCCGCSRERCMDVPLYPIRVGITPALACPCSGPSAGEETEAPW